MKIVIYSPDSRMRNPIGLFKEMLSSIKASRELAWRLTLRDISAQYRQSLLGYFWAFIPPLASTLVFVFLNDQGVIVTDDTTIPYAAYVLIGMVLWQTFVESVNAPLKVVTASKSTLAKINFPYEALIFSAIGQVLFGFAIKIIIIMGVFIAFQVPITWGLPLSLLVVLGLILLGISIGALITPMAVLFNDVSFGLMSGLTLWFFVTPVVYSTPNTYPISLLSTVNPVSPLLIAARDLATTGTTTNLLPLSIVLVATISSLLLIWVVFRVSIPILIERMSS